MFEGLKNKDGERNRNTVLTPEEKKRRLVLKRVNMDGAEQRSSFLRAGTMARVSVLRGSPQLTCRPRQEKLEKHTLSSRVCEF